MLGRGAAEDTARSKSPTKVTGRVKGGFAGALRVGGDEGGGGTLSSLGGGSLSALKGLGGSMANVLRDGLSSSPPRAASSRTLGSDDKKATLPGFRPDSILENNAEMTSLLLFHPFEPAIVVADDLDGISIWNYESGTRTRHFRNSNGSALGGESSHGSPAQTVTSLDWLNPEGPSLLSVASDDGVVRVWNGLLADGVFSPKRAPTPRAKASRGSERVGGGGGDGGVGGSGAWAKETCDDDDGLSGLSPTLVSSFRAAPDIYPNGSKNHGSGEFGRQRNRLTP